MKKVLLIPHLEVQNANALSSPHTIGFPAMSAWMGMVHALQRKLHEKTDYRSVEFRGLAVACHEIDLQVYREERDYVSSIIGTSNPLGKDGGRPSFVEEPRCHLKASIAVEIQSDVIDTEFFIEDVLATLLGSLKLAGGDILRMKKPEILSVDNQLSFRKLTNKLMPSWIITERRDLMIRSMEEGQNSLEALLDHLTVKNRSHREEDTEAVTWTRYRKEPGWIVPLATGFQGISELGHAENQRDPETPHRFAEAILTLGEFKMPHRFQNLDEMLWHYHVDLEKNLYLCQQNQTFKNMNQEVKGS